MECIGKEILSIFKEQQNSVTNSIKQLEEENKKLHIQLLKNYIMQEILKRQLGYSIGSICMEYGYVQIDNDRIYPQHSDLKEINEFLKGTGWKMKYKYETREFMVEKIS